MPFVWRTRSLLVADIFVVVWTLVWIVLGVIVVREVRQLEDLSETVVAAGDALDQSGEGLRGTSAGLREVHRALQVVESLPFVGREIEENLEGAADELDSIAREVEQTADSARESGRSSKESVEDLSLILGLAVALVPILTLLAAYAPLRSVRIRRALGLAP
jgi:methyl-accepting chemotaxis protein